MVTLSNYSLVPVLCKGSFAFFLSRFLQAFYFLTQRIKFQKMSKQLGIFSYFAEIDADGSGLLDREEVRGKTLTVKGNV